MSQSTVSHIGLIVRDPVLRLVAVLFMLFSAAIAGLIPYQALIAVDLLGINAQFYGTIIAVGGVFSVLTAVAAGIATDQLGTGRVVSLVASAIVVVGSVLMVSTQSAVIFAICHMFVFPVGGTVFVQLFALAKQRTNEIATERADSVMAILRAAFSLPFAFIPAIWGFVIAAGLVDLFAVYAATGTAVLCAAILGFLFWPNPKGDAKDAAKSGLSIAQSIGEITRPFVLSRLFFIASLQAMNTLYMMLIGLLIVQDLQGNEQQVGFFTGGVALLEIPFMLALAGLVGRYTKSQLIFVGGLIFAVFLVSLGAIQSLTQIWVLLIPAGMGAAVILSISVAYLQDLIAHRPGAGSSLIAVANFSGQLIAAALFAIVTLWTNYSGVAMVGGAISACCAVSIWLMDKGRSPVTSS